MRRLYMMEHGVRTLASLPPNGSEALALHKVEEANAAINALYLNIRGSIDNGAWAVVHHYQLVPEPNESKYRHQRIANLFAPEFLKKLGKKDQELSTRLETLAGWGRHLAKVRDPAAHRIPLAIPPSVVDETAVAAIEEIDNELAEAAQERDWEGFHDRMMARWNVGSFQRVVTLSEQQGLALVPLDALLNRDMGNVLEALELVVSWVFAEGKWTTSTNCGPLPRRIGKART